MSWKHKSMGSTPMTEKPVMEVDDDRMACNYAIKLTSSSVVPMTISAAIELGLLEHIAAAGPGAELTAEQLAARIGASNPHAPSMVERILRFLTSHSVFKCSAEIQTDGRVIHRYSAAPVCKYLTTNKDGVSMAALSLLSNDRVTMASWYYLKDAVLHGGVPFNMAHDGMTEFEYHKSDPRFSKVFNEGMRSHSIIIMKNLLDLYRGFDSIQMLVDVGGGTGGTLSMITTKYPHIKGINFDLPHVIAQAPALPGVEHVDGDAFASIPSGDAIFMKIRMHWILHDWCDEDSVKILKNCWKALPKNGKVIVVDSILPETPETTDVAQSIFRLDLIMLLESPSGKERTEKEFKKLAIQSGFSSFKLICNFSTVWVMKFIK